MSIQVQRPSSSFLEDSVVEGNHHSNIDNSKKSKSLLSIASSTGKKSTLGFNHDSSANKSFTGSVASATTTIHRKMITSLTGSIGPIGLGHFAVLTLFLFLFQVHFPSTLVFLSRDGVEKS